MPTPKKQAPYRPTQKLTTEASETVHLPLMSFWGESAQTRRRRRRRTCRRCLRAISAGSCRNWCATVHGQTLTYVQGFHLAARFPVESEAVNASQRRTYLPGPAAKMLNKEA
mmetsp:Transcript_36968/g.55120  ORF Transcript_36968/g.55120 Transcript_36968/m.55120 type:complete len:112 (-) Transcript_36968:130-465(-)